MPNLMRTTELSFELLEEIGHEGKNSTVYRATDVQLNAEIVIKKMPKAEFNDIDEYFNEASYLYLSSHPNVVPIHYACQDEEDIYLAMPHYVSGSLKQKTSQGPLAVREIIVYSTQILSGLHNIHSKGLIHFDVKPDNVLMSERGEALLSDFGLAKQITYSGVAGQDKIYGKMVPPEAFVTDQFNNQFDIYQVGLSIHRMCVGDTAFYSEFQSYFEDGQLNRDSFKHAVVNGQFPSRNNYSEHIPQKLIETIRKCLAVDCDQRYTSAVEVVNDISGIDGELLDWQLVINNDHRAWSKTLPDGRSFKLIVDPNGNALATKTSAKGNIQRMTAYCKESITRAEIKQFLREH